MPCRPLLRAISDAMDKHCSRAADGIQFEGDGKRGGDVLARSPTVTLQWIAAHSGGNTREAFGNRVVDCEAKWQRINGQASSKSQLHVGTGARWLSIRTSVLDGQHRILTGDVRRAAVGRFREMAREAWRDSSSSQRRYAHAAAGAREHWQFLAGDGRPRDDGKDGHANEPRADSRSCALFLRVVTDSLQFHTPSGHGHESWNCEAVECKEAAAGAQRIRRQQVMIPLTTAHLFDCRAPAVVAQRIAALRRADDIHRRFHSPNDSDVFTNDLERKSQREVHINEEKKESYEENKDNDGLLRWWQQLLQPLDESDESLSSIPPDDSTIAAAVGAFTAAEARSGMRTRYWRVPKEQRPQAVHQLRAMSVRTMENLWAATAATRRLREGSVTLELSAAVARGDYHPDDKKRDSDDSARHYRRDRRDDAEDQYTDADMAWDLHEQEMDPGQDSDDSNDDGKRNSAFATHCQHAKTDQNQCNSLKPGRKQSSLVPINSPSQGASEKLA